MTFCNRLTDFPRLNAFKRQIKCDLRKISRKLADNLQNLRKLIDGTAEIRRATTSQVFSKKLFPPKFVQFLAIHFFPTPRSILQLKIYNTYILSFYFFVLLFSCCCCFLLFYKSNLHSDELLRGWCTTTTIAMAEVNVSFELEWCYFCSFAIYFSLLLFHSFKWKTSLFF